MSKIVYRQMPAPRELSQQIPAPPEQKLGCKSPRVGANVWCKSPGVRGEMVMDEIDTIIAVFRKKDVELYQCSELCFHKNSRNSIDSAITLAVCPNLMHPRCINLIWIF